MGIPIAAGGLAWCADLVVAAIVLGGAFLGSRIGLFRSTVAGTLAMAASIFPLAAAEWLGRWLTILDLSPRLAPALALGLLLAAAVAWAVRLARTKLSEQAMRLPPMTDLVGGGIVGSLTGVVIAGTMLVTWSILPVPSPLRVEPTSMWFDTGSIVLRSFIRCLSADPEERSILLLGEPPATVSSQRPRRGPDGVNPPAADQPAGTCRASEPFVDDNANGVRDADEPYLDVDHNTIFSPRSLFQDANGNGRRDIGLLERYRLGRWHAVTQMSPEAVRDRVETGRDVPATDGQESRRRTDRL